MTDQDEPEKQQALKFDLEKLEGLDKVSIVFTAPKKVVGLKNQDEKWNINGVKKMKRNPIDQFLKDPDNKANWTPYTGVGAAYP